MAYEAKIILDSISPEGWRLTTFELTYPRFVHSELLTHRVFSRNSSSSRAIPIEKMIARVMNDPVLPVWWGKNQPGMQAEEELQGNDKSQAQTYWLEARDNAVDIAVAMVGKGVHKQIVNRILEPWMWITVILSGTDFGNFFSLRCDKAAQPEIKKIAEMACELYYESPPPRMFDFGEWHMPYLPDFDHLSKRKILAERDGKIFDLREISAARCARVSYLTHDGVRDLSKDKELFDRLIGPGHFSPLEHVAMPEARLRRGAGGNFMGWTQFRKSFPGENRDIFNYVEWKKAKLTQSSP